MFSSPSSSPQQSHLRSSAPPPSHLRSSAKPSSHLWSSPSPPIVVPGAKTTAYHAYFDSGRPRNGRPDQVLKRVCGCEPIRPADLPDDVRFAFGMAVGVGGEVLSKTLEKMTRICDLVFVDVQALNTDFDRVDGAVKLVKLRETGFYRLLPRIGVLKASSEEATFLDVEEIVVWFRVWLFLMLLC